MSVSATLVDVKTAIGMTGTPDAVVQPWFDETIDFLKHANKQNYMR